MSKGLEALKNIKREKPTFFSAIYDCDMWKEDTETIEKELEELEERREMMKRFNEACVPRILDNKTEKTLKAFEIVKKKSVNLGLVKMVAFMKKQGADCYNSYFSSQEMHLTSKEFDLLKEVLQ